MEDLSFIQRITFVIIQTISLLFLVGFATSLAASGILSSYNQSGKSTQAAKQTAVVFALASIGLWLLNWFVGQG